MKSSKPILLVVVAAVVAGIVWLIWPKDEPDPTIADVEAVIQTDGAKEFITVADYESLAEMYANEPKNNNDTTGFYAYMCDLLVKNGYEPSILPDMTMATLPERVVLYLDNTASMKGYLKPQSMSITDLVNVLNGLKSNYGEIDAFYVNADSLEKIDFEALVTKLNTKNVATYDAYSMNEFIETIVKRSKADTLHRVINFFLTDAIPSGTSAEINANPEFNREHKTTLERRIFDAMKDDSKGYGLSIYQLGANFDGTYINYCNNKDGKRVNPKTQRPVYLIAIGDKDMVRSFRDKAEKEEIQYFKPEKGHTLHSTNVYSGNVAPTVSGASCGSVERDEDGIYRMPASEKSYTVNLPLNAIPEYLINAEDIANPAAMVPFTITINGEDKTDLLRQNGNIAYNEESNILQISAVRGGDLEEESVKISFQDQLPGWVTATSCDEDSDINMHPGKTFNLDIVVNGLVRGLNGLTGSSLGEPIVVNMEFNQ